MNSCNDEFLRRNGIDPEKMRRAVDCTVYRQQDINKIVFAYDFQGRKARRNVSVADIVGNHSSREHKDDIFESMDHYFDANGDGYHRRSVGLLEHGPDDMIDVLQRSFESEPLSLIETGEGSYTILNNGFHRFTLLRILYLKELSEAQGNPEKIEAIKRKYTIPADVTPIDLDKTYCKFILRQISPPESLGIDIYQIDSYYDRDKGQMTDDVIIGYEQDGESKERIVTTEQLMNIAKNVVREFLRQGDKIPFLMDSAIDEYKSFREFLERNFPELLQKKKDERAEGGEEYV